MLDMVYYMASKLRLMHGLEPYLGYNLGIAAIVGHPWLPYGNFAITIYVTFFCKQNIKSHMTIKLIIHHHLQSREVDENGDGRFDYLDFNLEMPINGNEDVRSVQLLLFFHYKLHVSLIII